MSDDTVANASATRSFFEWIISFLPLGILVKLMNFSLAVQDLGYRTVKQFDTTMNLLMKSFGTQYVSFYKVDNHFVPVHHYDYSVSYAMPGHLEWTYNFSNQTFVHRNPFEETHDERQLPFIGARLHWKNNTEVADLSDWIANVKVRAADGHVPAPILAMAWAFEKQVYLMNLDLLCLTVMTLTAEEISYELLHGEQYTMPPEETESETTDVVANAQELAEALEAAAASN